MLCYVGGGWQWEGGVSVIGYPSYLIDKIRQQSIVVIKLILYFVAQLLNIITSFGKTCIIYKRCNS